MRVEEAALAMLFGIDMGLLVAFLINWYTLYVREKDSDI